MRNVTFPKPLIYIHLFIFSLLICYFTPSLRKGIAFLDIHAAYFFNSFIHTSPLSQNFWAFMNSRYADWLNDLVMVSFLLPYIFLGKKEERGKRSLQVLFLVLFTIFCFFYCNRLLFMKLIHAKRPSPTRVLPDLFHLSHVIHWVKVKVGSSSCYPADHSCTYFMFILGMFHLQGRKIGLLAFFISLPFILPRLITGAHWISDLLMGSLPMALFNLGWLFHTGAFDYIIHQLMRRYENSRAYQKL